MKTTCSCESVGSREAAPRKKNRDVAPTAESGPDKRVLAPSADLMPAMVQNSSYVADGTQPETEWACNRCMYAWDGQIWCPHCGHQATHGRAYKQ